MASDQELAEWIRETLDFRTGLPYEISAVVDDCSTSRLENSIRESILHVRRVLDFYTYTNNVSDDSEEYWYDTLCTLDDVSYYACLALPMIRQVLEPATDFLFSDTLENAIVDDSVQDDLPAALSGLELRKRRYATRACQLSSQCTIMRSRLSNVRNIDEFRTWSRSFLMLASSLIQLTASISLTLIDIEKW